MKKIFTVLLSFVVILTLGACNTSEESADNSNGESTEETSYASLTKDNYIEVDTENNEIQFLATVNGTYFTESTMHFTSWKDGSNGTKSMLSSYPSHQEFYDALVEIGAEPGDNLTMDSDQGAIIEGSELEIVLLIDGEEVRVEDAVTTTDGEKVDKFDFRFGGNEEVAQELETGCLICLVSCPAGIVSPTAFGFGTGVTFTGDADVFPADGTDIVVIVRLV